MRKLHRSGATQWHCAVPNTFACNRISHCDTLNSKWTDSFFVFFSYSFPTLLRQSFCSFSIIIIIIIHAHECNFHAADCAPSSPSYTSILRADFLFTIIIIMGETFVCFCHYFLLTEYTHLCSHAFRNVDVRPNGTCPTWARDEVRTNFLQIKNTVMQSVRESEAVLCCWFGRHDDGSFAIGNWALMRLVSVRIGKQKTRIR